MLEVLSAGPARVADIVARIYFGLDPALVPQAHESVLAHLEKLDADGVAERAGAARGLAAAAVAVRDAAPPKCYSAGARSGM